jgi:hypothetical protein
MAVYHAFLPQSDQLHRRCARRICDICNAVLHLVRVFARINQSLIRESIHFFWTFHPKLKRSLSLPSKKQPFEATGLNAV